MRILFILVMPFALLMAVGILLRDAVRSLIAYVSGHTTSSEPIQALTQPELHHLAQCLAAQDGQAAHPISNLWALDGYLTATLIGPLPMSPNQWLAPLLGQRPLQGERLQDALQLVSRYENMLATALYEDPYVPLFKTALYPKNDKPDLHHWCQGFMAGVKRNERQWDSLIDSALGSNAWQRITRHASNPGETAANKRGAFTTATLKRCVMEIQAHWAVANAPEWMNAPQPHDR